MFCSSSQATSREYGQSCLSVDTLSDDLFPPSLKYFTPSKWIARIMVSWGIVTICTAAVTSYEGLIVVRIFLGIAEAGFFPGIMMYLCFCE
jgi:MFS family permease